MRLSREMLVTVAWIAERLRMGSVANVNTLLYQWAGETQKVAVHARRPVFYCLFVRLSSRTGSRPALVA